MIRHLSVSPGELPTAIERAQAENKDLRKAIERMEEAVRYGTIRKKWLECAPDLRFLRDQPRFKALLERL